jgi:hypothetical protein
LALVVAAAAVFAGAASSDGQASDRSSPIASAAKSLRYVGTTSEGREVELRVERKGRKRLTVRDATAGFGPWQCGNTGAPEGLTDIGLVIEDVKVRGRFFRSAVPGFVEGTIRSTTATFKSGLKQVSGTITHSGEAVDPTNRPCTYSSASVRFVAKRR